MEEKELLPSSDESDTDFVPKEEDFNSGSDSNVSDCVSTEGEDDAKRGRKRKKRNKKGGKKTKVCPKDSEVGEEEKEEEESQESKIDVDALWADFKKDVNNKEIKKTASVKPETDLTEKNNCSEQDSKEEKHVGNKPKAIPGSANRRIGGGLCNVLNQIGKKDKMSTLRKSQLDWNKFKKNEGIEDEIKQYNRGKDGYLERQDFLQRTDLRQFEIEKDLRSARRKF